MLSYSTLIVAAATTFIACDKRKSDEAVIQAFHNPAQCPKDVAGAKFVADEARTTPAPTIEIAEDKDKKLIAVVFNGVESVVVNADKYPQVNGAELRAGCINNTIQIAGKDMEGKDLKIVLKRDEDKDASKAGLDFRKSSPD